jgi:hypothetical protein
MAAAVTSVCSLRIKALFVLVQSNWNLIVMEKLALDSNPSFYLPVTMTLSARR